MDYVEFNRILSQDGEERLNSIISFFSQAHLMDSASYLEMIKDEQLLHDVILHLSDPHLRLLGFRLLSKPELIASVIQHLPQRRLQLEGLYRLEEQDDLLTKIILNTKNHFDVKFQALEKIKHEHSLHLIAQASNDTTIRKLAVSRSKDPELLLQVISKDTSAKIRRVAVEQLPQTFQKALTKIAIHDPNYFVRESAVDKVVTNDLLFNIASESKHLDIIKIAVSKISDITLLTSLKLVLPDAIRKDLDKQIEKHR